MDELWSDCRAAGANAAARLWTRWWWMGGSQTRAGISEQLRALADAGFGGVEISPIYGVPGAPTTDFLSPEWLDLLRHALAEAHRLGLGVDLIEGTGWPFGAGWVSETDGAKRLRAAIYDLPFPGEFPIPETHPEDRNARRIAATAIGPDGQRNTLASAVASAPGPGHKLAVGFLGPTRQRVKRAAPGGDGLVVDPFDPDAIRRYLSPFVSALDALPPGAHSPGAHSPGAHSPGARPRALFNDSWEVFGANAPGDILAQFQKRRGYDLALHLDALAPVFSGAETAWVLADFRRTLAELTREFVENWTAHARSLGIRSRNQAHGSPGNLLDLYAAADIPETELFGASILTLTKEKPLPPDGEVELDDTASEQLFTCRFASSAAHVSGKTLVSSESFTWLGEHGKTPLSHLKAEADLLFCAGINHLFCHGTAYSPPEIPWPGWMFYASTHVAPTNTFWPHVPALTSYVARIQAALQTGLPDNDVLLYFPFDDLCLAGDEEGSGARDLLHFLSVHATSVWLRKTLAGFHALGQSLLDSGVALDFVSDRQLESTLKREAGALVGAGGSRYRALVIPACRSIPPETERVLRRLEDAGFPVIRATGDGAGSVLAALSKPETGVRVESGLARAKIRFCRRRIGRDTLYFLLAPPDAPVDDEIALAAAGAFTDEYDPLTGRRGRLAPRVALAPHLTLAPRVALAPGETRLVRVHAVADASAPSSPLPRPKSEPLAILSGVWNVSFLDGGPVLPPPATVLPRADHTLAPWNTWPGTDSERTALRDFSGTAHYSLRFDAPGGQTKGLWLDLGDVRYSARVSVNGDVVATLVSAPFRVLLPELRASGNHLEIEVANVAANRLAALDRAKANWRPFYFVNIRYKPFDASAWPAIDSGLLGPISLYESI